MNIKIKSGEPPQLDRWKIGAIPRGKYAEYSEVEHHGAIRSAATRIGKRMKRQFSVRKVLVGSGYVIRVYRTDAKADKKAS